MIQDPLPAGLVAALANRDAFPLSAGADGPAEHVQTHLSHVFLTADRVYKLRKDVDLEFVRFGCRAERNADCLREIRLNRRLAADVYLGVAPVRPIGASFAVGEPGESIADAGQEHCVVMRRLPEGRDALSLLRAGRLDREQVQVVAERIAGFHADNAFVCPDRSASDWLRECTAPLAACFADLRASGADPEQLARVVGRESAFASRRGEHLAARGIEGRWVDGHGDLHLQHVWFEDDDAPRIIDCLEFSDDLRHVDAACDVAFFAMDLVYRQEERLANAFLERYAARSDDYGLYDVVDYYIAYRALVRARVAAIAAGDARIDAAQREAARSSVSDHLVLAERALQPTPPGTVFLSCGPIGSGKSSAAEVVSASLGAAMLRSDLLRKKLAGLEPSASAAAAPDSGLYAPERRSAVYLEMLARAATVVASGRPVMADASFATAEQRSVATRWARERGADVRWIETRCDAEETLGRLKRRAQETRDPSDAGPELYEMSVARFEPPDEIPSDRRLVVHTDRPGWREALRDRLREA